MLFFLKKEIQLQYLSVPVTKKYRISIAGLTTDGKFVVNNVFKFTSTEGVPLTEILIYCQNHNMIIDWLDYYNSAISLGMERSRILSRISADVADSFGTEYRNTIIDKLNKCIDIKERV